MSRCQKLLERDRKQLLLVVWGGLTLVMWASAEASSGTKRHPPGNPPELTESSARLRFASYSNPARPVTLRSIELENFRNFRALGLTLDPRGGILEAPNGRGKTNLLEAIHYLSLFRSFRGAPDAELVTFGERGFRLLGETDGHAQRRIGLSVEGLRKRLLVDGKPGRPADNVGAALSVVLSPTDIRLVQGSPARRRRYLDVILALSSARYMHALQEYHRALKQRNRVLQTSGWSSSAALLEPWTDQLVTHGSVLLEGRHRLLSVWGRRFGEISAQIASSPEGTLEWRYESGLVHSVELQPVQLQPVLARDAEMESPDFEASPALGPIRYPRGDDEATRFGGEGAGCASDLGPDASRTRNEGWREGVAPEGAEEERRSAYAEALRSELERRVHIERRRGATLAGPHRDDVSFIATDGSGGKRDIRKFGSQGEHRSAALALRFLEAEILTRERGELPVVLLDDVFSELDPRRSREVLGLLREGQQIFLTTPKPLGLEIPLDLPRYGVSEGTVRPA
jgi:DNA replication and repair protein RecF